MASSFRSVQWIWLSLAVQKTWVWVGEPLSLAWLWPWPDFAPCVLSNGSISNAALLETHAPARALLLVYFFINVAGVVGHIALFGMFWFHGLVLRQAMGFASSIGLGFLTATLMMLLGGAHMDALAARSCVLLEMAGVEYTLGLFFIAPSIVGDVGVLVWTGWVGQGVMAKEDFRV